MFDRLSFSTRNTRIDPDAVELALDLTSEAITLYERGISSGWKKFAAARLDDPEFPIVIGLLRNEAETLVGGHQPVRLWLPGEQVLKQRARIDGDTPAARRQAVFDYIERETVYRPEDVAVAYTSPNRDGKTTLLITFVETWREARTYATRWGFLPGNVSTRNNATDFGSEGPIFLPRSVPREPIAVASRNRIAVAALAVTVIAAGSAAWTLRPWESQFTNPIVETSTTVEIAQAPPIEAPQIEALAIQAPPFTATPEPVPTTIATAPAPVITPAPEPEPETLASAVPPKHVPNASVLPAPDDTDSPPVVLASLMVFNPPGFPNALTAPAPTGLAPLPLPDPEPAPLERDLVAAWIGPVPEIQPGEFATMFAEKDLYRVMQPLDLIEQVALLSNGKAPPQYPPSAPVLEPLPTVPASTTDDTPELFDSALAPLEVPMPLPRLARLEPAANAVTLTDVNPTPMVLPPPRPAGMGRAATVPETEVENVPAPLPPLAPVVEIPAEVPPTASVDGQTLVSAKALDLVELLPADPPTKYASLTAPVPLTRPSRSMLPTELPTVAILPNITGSTKNSIRTAATEQGLALEETALIGILNLDAGRKALLRLPNGRYRSVVLGDEIDGWKVSIIGTDAMRVTRSGKDRTLLLVNR